MIIRRLKKPNTTTRFIIKAVVLMISWFVVYEGFLRTLQQPDTFLTQITAGAGALSLNLLGYNIEAAKVAEGSELFLDNEPLLLIASNCNGLIVFALFAAFILIFPKNWSKKLLFIPAGVMLLFLLNVLRVTSLSLIQIYHAEWLEFNHKYSFTILMYAAVFGLWMLWVKKFATPSSSSKKLAVA
ncbi:Transmembrane exosortase (Exosortase_EpsH) [Flammeovirgaceae bacterium 311]|nr:Transmembrane exosortase (Exosortase_EpsH) [Flammeovirgaceae bacterium 311]